MGTRGLLGVRIDGVDKLTYNHFDSYPEGLGVDVLEALRALVEKPGLKGVMKLARAIRLVNKDEPATPEDVEKFGDKADTGVGSQSVSDWYCLLRDAQGDLCAYLDMGVMINNHTFILDSLFCEWAYIVNLDSMVLEVYTGFQDKPHNKGRYAKHKPEPSASGSTYYACALIATFDLKNLPTTKRFHEVIRAALPPEEDE